MTWRDCWSRGPQTIESVNHKLAGAAYMDESLDVQVRRELGVLSKSLLGGELFFKLLPDHDCLQQAWSEVEHEIVHSGNLLAELRGLIEQARQHVAQATNSTLTMLHWQLGQRIYLEVLAGQRASYGEEILPTLSAKLEPEYGKGFSARNLARMVRFAEALPDEPIVATLSRQLSWSHFVEILPLEQPLERERAASGRLRHVTEPEGEQE